MIVEEFAFSHFGWISTFLKVKICPNINEQFETCNFKMPRLSVSCVGPVTGYIAQDILIVSVYPRPFRLI